MSDALKRLSELADEQMKLERDIEYLMMSHDTLKKKHAELTEKVIPELMQSVGIEKFTTMSGLHISIKEDIATNITKTNADMAFAWLREHGYDGIIKREIKLNFGKGEDELASKALHELSPLGVAYADKQFIHPQTLKAFVNEQLSNGNPIPLDVFGVVTLRKSKLI